ncbi:MAG: TraB/GumN family protein [Pseudomonadota bacterium]
MRMMPVALLLCLVWPQLAFAACEGRDLLAELQQRDPAAHQRIFERAAAIPNHVGVFWKVETPGAAPSWLLGTYHDTEMGRRPLGRNVAQALDGARLMLVEMTDAEIARMNERIETDPSFSFAPSDTGLVVAGEDRARLDAALSSRGITVELAGRMRPWLLFATFGFPLCQIRELSEGAPIMDQALADRAEAAGTPVAGLETYEQALSAFDGIPDDAMKALVGDLLAWTDAEEDLRRTNLGLYEAEQVAAILAYSVEISAAQIGETESERLSDSFVNAVLTNRNEAWMDVLVREVALGGVFAAMGALHLPGETGIVALLRERGFTVTRQAL